MYLFTDDMRVEKNETVEVTEMGRGKREMSRDEKTK